MTQYETLSILIACLAAMVSVVVWMGQRKLQREANELQRAQAALAQKQLEILLRQEAGMNKARLSFQLEKEGRASRFVVTNVSEVAARDVEVELLIDPKHSPLVKGDYDQKFPAKRLGPGDSVSLIAALHFGTPLAYNALLKWTNPDGTHDEEEMYTAL
jgi:hypothetical protein